MNKSTTPGWVTVSLWFTVGVFLNIIGSDVAGRLTLPIYLDCIGTILSAMCGGMLTGVLTGLVTNLLNSASDPQSIYYMFANMITAVAAVWVFRKKKWFTPSLLVWLVVVMSFICSGFTTLLVWFTNGRSNPYEIRAIGDALRSIGMQPLGTAFVGNWMQDFLDKGLTVIIVSVLILILIHLGLYEDKDHMDGLAHIDVRTFSLQTKLVWFFSIVIVVIGLAAISIGAWLFSQSSIKDHISLGQGVTSLVADQMDPERINDWLEHGESEPDYVAVESRLARIRHNYPDVEYVYVYQIREDGCHVVFDLDTEGVEGSEPGTVIPFDESFEPYVDDLLAGRTIAPIITNDTYGDLLTVYQPVYDKNRKCICYAAMDVSMKRIRNITTEFVAKLIALFMAWLLLGLIMLFLYSRKNIVDPLNRIADASSLELDTEAHRRKCVANMEDLEISTGDEIEHLYNVLLSNMKDTVTFMETLRKKDEDLAMLQDGLIRVLAEAVESRDHSTGNHIKRTASYVSLIMDELSKSGPYKDLMTEEYMMSVSRSATLHDVGKIKIPDAILNKPGRLTDEEYGEIKTHTISGLDIIEEAIQVVPDPLYLKEARDMAANHHEKWDGSGYPYGKKGEEIPLAARIMAVADVFDALSAKRVYKDAFPVEKALAIIKNDSGTHFDPYIVEAFLNRAEEAAQMAKEMADME